MVFELTRSGDGTWSEKVLYNFGVVPMDGDRPGSTMAFDATGNLYGTTFGSGTVFELSPSGDAWTENILYDFRGKPDGVRPLGPVIVDRTGNLYGTTSGGGSGNAFECTEDQFAGCGTVWELSPQPGGGWAESILYSFQGASSDGQWPGTGVIFDGSGDLLGSTSAGGCRNIFCGIVFGLVPSQGRTVERKNRQAFQRQQWRRSI